MKLIEAIQKCKDFFAIDAVINEINFSEYASIDKSNRGVYVISDENENIIYVGKGFLKKRQESHWKKSLDAKNEIYNPKGWLHLKENHDINPEEWKLVLVVMNKETELSAMEGALIHILQPLANDETFKDIGG